MANIIKFGGGLVSSATSSVPVIGTDFNWTGGDNTYLVLTDDGGNWRIKFLSSGVFTPLNDMTIDAFLVGGGGSGAAGSNVRYAGGGGGGYTKTIRNVKLEKNTEYEIVIGDGGKIVLNGITKVGNNGGDTTAFGITVSGGKGASQGTGKTYNGGDGGSGGGAATASGGSDGNDGNSSGSYAGGTGQGTTTREFEESDGDLYASGGPGGGVTSSENAKDNSGDGGCGMSSSSSYNGLGGYGGSGIVIIRKHKEIPATASLTAQSGVSYTNGLEGLSANTVSLFSAAISNNSNITNETSVVYLDNGDIHRKISVGDQVTLSLNGTDYAFDIIGFNHDTLTDTAAYGEETATGKAGITFQMHDLFATTYSMNSTDTNSGGWKSSAMRTSTMATMKGYLPDDWEAIIKPVNKASGTGGGSSSGTETVSDSCFLLAEIEVFGSITYSVSGEGTQYAYYKANSNVKNIDGSAYNWWERSPYSGYGTNFCVSNDKGIPMGSYATNSRGVAFGFCV